MAVAGKLEAEVKLKSSADLIFKLLSRHAYKIPKAVPDMVTKLVLLKGDWETSGFVKFMKYIKEGSQEIYKDMTEIDEPNMTVSYIGLEGDLLQKYKTYTLTFAAVPKDCGSLVKITIDYEKFKPTDPSPTDYLAYVAYIVTRLDAYLVKIFGNDFQD